MALMAIIAPFAAHRYALTLFLSAGLFVFSQTTGNDRTVKPLSSARRVSLTSNQVPPIAATRETRNPAFSPAVDPPGAAAGATMRARAAAALTSNDISNRRPCANSGAAPTSQTNTIETVRFIKGLLSQNPRAVQPPRQNRPYNGCHGQ